MWSQPLLPTSPSSVARSFSALLLLPCRVRLSSGSGCLLVTSGVLSPLAPLCKLPYSLPHAYMPSHSGEALFCCFWPHVHIFSDFFFHCLHGSENVTLVGFLHPYPLVLSDLRREEMGRFRNRLLLCSYRKLKSIFSVSATSESRQIELIRN